MYDVCWIRKLGININGLIVDTMIASSIDENRFSYTLNTLSWHHLSKGKNEKKLIEAAKKEDSMQKLTCGDYLLWKLEHTQKRRSLTLELWHKCKNSY